VRVLAGLFLVAQLPLLVTEPEQHGLLD